VAKKVLDTLLFLAKNIFFCRPNNQPSQIKNPTPKRSLKFRPNLQPRRGFILVGGFICLFFPPTYSPSHFPRHFSRYMPHGPLCISTHPPSIKVVFSLSRAGQDRTGQDRTGQDRTGQFCHQGDRDPARYRPARSPIGPRSIMQEGGGSAWACVCACAPGNLRGP